MPHVAAYKADNQLPVEDLAREKTVIASSTSSAAKENLDESSVKAFFQAQITLAKIIQYRVRAQLLLEPDAIDSADLNNDIRPRLLKLGKQINKQLYLQLTSAPLEETDYNTFASAISIPYITEMEKRYLFDRLIAVKLANDANQSSIEI